MLRSPEAATAAATAALRRAGRSRSSVLAHARFHALLEPEPPAPSRDSPAPEDLTELAEMLAATRPAVERAVIDLRGRLDRADLGRALGVSAAGAAERADAIAEGWDRDLDPILMARLGAGDCLELAAILAAADLRHPTLDEVSAAGPAVATHVAGCEMCGDRHRAMVSVRSLFAQVDRGPAPAAVKDAARRARRMRPAPAPPPVDPRRRRLGVVAAVVVAAIVGSVAVGGAVFAITRPGGERAKRVAALVKVPPTSRLTMSLHRDVVEIANHSSRPLRWRATAEAPWLAVKPAQGELAAGAVQSLGLRVLPSSPEGALRTTVTVTGVDGSAVAAVYETTVERPPDVAASLEGCLVTATVEDTSGVGRATLHWTRPEGAGEATMTQTNGGYAASVPAGRALTWWVEAADTRGNLARSPESKATC